jgi:hypothetical protein
MSGSTGAPAFGNIDLIDGETLFVVWSGGDAGATATATFVGNTIPFDQVGGSEIRWSDPIAANDGSLIFPAIKSPNFVSGSAGWRIAYDGTVEFNNGTFRGTLVIGTSPQTTVDTNGITVVGANQTMTVNDNTGFEVVRTSLDGRRAQLDLLNSTGNAASARLALNPVTPTAGANTIGASASLSAAIAGTPDEIPFLLIASPRFTSKVNSSITMEAQSSASAVDNSLIFLTASSTSITGGLFVTGASSIAALTASGTSTLAAVTATTVAATGNVTGKRPNGKVALNTATQAIALSTVTAVPYAGTDIRDDANFHDPVTNNTRVTPSVAGVYRVTLCTSWAAGTATNRLTFIRKNGTSVVTPTMNETAPTTAFQQLITGTITCNGSTDFFEHCVSSGVAINITGIAGASDTGNPNTTMEWEYIASA